MERVAGIEPASSAWKAEVLPLYHTRVPGEAQGNFIRNWWRGLDSNQRRLSQQIYSLPPLATREPLHTRLHKPDLQVNPKGRAILHFYCALSSNTSKYGETGAGNRSRTRDILITSEVLYQLSYAGKGGA